MRPTTLFRQQRAKRLHANTTRPQVQPLEARLPLGDVLLGAVLGPAWLARSLALPERGSGEAEGAADRRPIHHGLAQTALWSTPEADRARAALAFSFTSVSVREEPIEAPGGDATEAFRESGRGPAWETATAPPEWATLAAVASAPVGFMGFGLAQTGSSARGTGGPALVFARQAPDSGRGPAPPLMVPGGAARPSEQALLATLALLAAPPAARTAGPTQPNFVFLITDDQDNETLQYMPRLHQLLAEQGVTFRNMFITNPLCCPSHVSFLSGQYPHNHGVLNNTYPLGGWRRFYELDGEHSTLATWLQDAGYYTGRFGKYLVEYPEPSTHVPPGWNEWFSFYTGAGRYFNYNVNDNGTVVHYGSRPEEYGTDVVTGKAVDFLARTEQHDEQPFFLFFAPSPPHADGQPNGPATPAPRHQGMFKGAMAPRTPSFNEADVSDKPPPTRNLAPLTEQQIAAIDSEYQTRIESLQAMDESVATLVAALAEHGELDNTFIFYTTDNGYHLGQHRLYNGKGQIYEEDIHTQLFVRGPGVPRGVTLDHLVLNIDLAPTLAELGGATPTRAMDGRSLVPLVGDDPPPPHRWRHDLLVELYRPNGEQIRALRTLDAVYVEYLSGARELYDLRTDPYQLESQHDLTPPGHLRKFSRRLGELATCAEESCRQ